MDRPNREITAMIVILLVITGFVMISGCVNPLNTVRSGDGLPNQSEPGISGVEPQSSVSPPTMRSGASSDDGLTNQSEPGISGAEPQSGDSLPSMPYGVSQKSLETPMHTYFSVNCHAHEDRGDGSYTDITMDGDIPVEMIGEWDKEPYLSRNLLYTGDPVKINYHYIDSIKCLPDSRDCGDCKYTFDGPSWTNAIIERNLTFSAQNWYARFNFFGTGYQNIIDENYVPPDGKQVLPGCTDPLSQEDMNMGAEYAVIMCQPPTQESLGYPFTLREGEVINDMEKNGDSFRTVTYVFHIRAQ